MDYLALKLFLMAISSQSSWGHGNISTRDEGIRLRRQSEGGPCILPPYPDRGQYTIGGKPDARPGDTLDALQLQVSCLPGFQPLGDDTVFCVLGTWSNDLPQCVRYCKLDPHPSVRYRCSITNEDGYRDCTGFEPPGTTATPQCNQPNYYYTGVKPLMRCINGRWDHIVVCTPDCGRITPKGQSLLIGGREARRGEFPWHAGVYLKPQVAGAPHRQICGGSIISTRVIISAAHCFWHQEKVRPASSIAVAVGKLYRMFDSPLDDDVQKFDVSKINIPVRYQDVRTNYQDDIAAVTLSADIVYRPHVLPVCVDFDPYFDHTQLKEGNLGKVAGWGYTDKDGNPSPVLKVLEIPYVSVERCIGEAPASFKPYITSDKICAGYHNGSAVCRGDSGGGLVFPAPERGTERHYLRGVVSTAPTSEDACNAYALTSFTQILQHSRFIEQNTVLDDLTPPPPVQQYDTAVCVLPAYPTNGRYAMAGTPGALPGQAYLSAQLETSCSPGFMPDHRDTTSCSYGRWSGVLPQCVRQCKLPADKTATYRCFKESPKEDWECNEFEPIGVKATIVCGNRQLASDSYNGAECKDGAWTGNLRCEAGCGQGNLTSDMEQPWAAAVYLKKDNQFACGASVLNSTTILTAAHCMWDYDKETRGSPAAYVISAGARHPLWNDTRNQRHRQTAEVLQIHIPSSFDPDKTEADIALVFLKNPLEFNERVQPACLDLESRYLPADLEEIAGKTLSWNIVDKEGDIDFENATLDTVDATHEDRDTCLRELRENLRRYLSTDSFCAKSLNEKRTCTGDTGHGFVVPAEVRGSRRYFLRGVASGTLGRECHYRDPMGFTDVNKFKKFLRMALSTGSNSL